jgi:endonuclease/exonuclease/phosphatase family metal-dependent hydrolase
MSLIQLVDVNDLVCKHPSWIPKKRKIQPFANSKIIESRQEVPPIVIAGDFNAVEESPGQ